MYIELHGSRMPLKFILSRRNKRCLIHDGFIYNQQKINKNSIQWRCERYDNTRCPGRAWTTSDKRTGDLIKTSDHHHPGDSAVVEVKKTLSKLVKKAQKSELKTKTVVSKAVANISDEASALLPCIPVMKRRVQRARARKRTLFPTPNDRESLIIPDEFTVTHKNEPFLLHDSGPSKRRFLIFSTTKNLQCLSSCDMLFADGTFRSVPKIFLQLYTIHGRVNGKIMPLVYMLLPDKRARTYISAINVLKEKEPRLNPECIMIDFETTFVSTLSSCFPDAIIKGCHFHLGQCVYRHVQLDGKQRLYGQDIQFSSAVKMLIALAYVPTDYVIDSFSTLCDSDYFVENRNLLNGIINYFEHTWIGSLNPRGNGRRKPLFAIDMWNCYDAVLNDDPRSNNSVEGWHHGFNEAIDRAHTSMGKFIDVLREEQSLTDVLMAQNDVGRSIRDRKRRRYAVYDESIKAVVRNFETIEIVDYLTRISRLVVL